MRPQPGKGGPGIGSLTFSCCDFVYLIVGAPASFIFLGFRPAGGTILCCAGIQICCAGTIFGTKFLFTLLQRHHSGVQSVGVRVWVSRVLLSRVFASRALPSRVLVSRTLVSRVLMARVLVSRIVVLRLNQPQHNLGASGGTPREGAVGCPAAGAQRWEAQGFGRWCEVH